MLRSIWRSRFLSWGSQVADVQLIVRTASLSTLKIWSGLNLDRRFGILALTVAAASTVVIGLWVATTLEAAILSRSSGVASVYIGDLVSPHLQDLATTGQISSESAERLDALLVNGALRLKVVAMKVWREDGTIVYSDNPNLVGRRYTPDKNLLSAFNGKIISEMNEPSEESAHVFGTHSSIFEVYAPVYDRRTGKIIAVAEFYEDASEMEFAVVTAKVSSWVFTIFVLFCNVLAYYLVVHGGSQTIETQRFQLTQRIDELSKAMSRERALRARIEQSAQKAFDENERFLRALGADLHDGPAQLIGLALLKLDPRDGEIHRATLLQARSAITQAMREIRGIAAGLHLPDIDGQPLEACIKATVRNHEAKTGTVVRLTCFGLRDDCPTQIKICACRFIQEGLANAFHHARGLDQRVHVDGGANFIRVTVADSGPGMPKVPLTDDDPHFGLICLRDRVENLNGTMKVSSLPQRGTRIVARLPLNMEKPDAV